MAGKSNRKHGRNKKRCQAYKLQGLRERNKLRKMLRHCKANPSDKRSLSLYKAKGGKTTTNILGMEVELL